MEILENVTFAYVKLMSPVETYKSPGSTEFSVCAIVSKKEAREWNKKNPGNQYKEYDNDDFLETFAMENLPYPDQDGQYVIKFKKAHTKNGVELPAAYRPRAFLQKEDGKVEDITLTTQIANGSKGDVEWSTFGNSFGTFVQLSSILVKDLIEYKSEASATPGSSFGVKTLAPVPTNQKAVKKQGDDPVGDYEPPEPSAKKAAPKAVVKKGKPPVADIEDGDAPF